MAAPEILTLPPVTILGAGAMGRAILGGLLGPSVRIPGGIRITNRTARTEGPPAGVTAYAMDENPDANRVAVRGAGIVLLAVKPGMVSGLLTEIADELEPGVLVVSVAAGVPIATLERNLPTTATAFRAMPNTPAKIGRAVTGISASSRANPADIDVVTALFSTVGSVLAVPETQLDALSTISGSGPAYVYYLIEQWLDVAVSLGFTADQATQLVIGTFGGSLSLLESTGQPPATLRAEVTSPRGTTERAVAVLQQAGLADLFGRASVAALARARELAAEA